MTKSAFTLHRDKLLALRSRLQGDMCQMEGAALNHDHSRTTSMPNHMAELGSDSFDQELTLSLLGSEKNALDQIEAAISRIDDGSFGRCETCGEQIPKNRLEAIPYASQCVRCASQGEEGPGTARQVLIVPRLKAYACTRAVELKSRPCVSLQLRNGLPRRDGRLVVVPPGFLTTWFFNFQETGDEPQ